jgi:arylsulfatase A-like enzyme
MIRWFLLSILACAGLPGRQPPPEEARALPNVMLVVLDDVGAERVAAYGSPYPSPPTPTLSTLAQQGIRFSRAWSNPVCSPTRATLLTGRYARRTGIGRIVDSWKDEPELALSEVTLPELLARAQTPYDSSAVGKWHLGSQRTGPMHPGRQGFAWWAGPAGNLRDRFDGGKSGEWGYFRWMKNEGGQVREAQGYVTTDTTDDAIARMQTMQEPWFLYVAYNAAHFPMHTPPPGLGLPGVDDRSPEPDRYDSVLVALDAELGRLMQAMSPEVRQHTYVFVVGDNGTPDFAIRPPLDPADAKGSVRELGVHVPLLVTGPDIEPGSVSRALVHTVDLFATIAELAGFAPRPVDGISFRTAWTEGSSPRRFLFTEEFSDNGPGPHDRVTVAIRDEDYKLVVDRKRRGTAETLYRMGDWVEQPAEDKAAARVLREELARIEGSF